MSLSNAPVQQACSPISRFRRISFGMNLWVCVCLLCACCLTSTAVFAQAEGSATTTSLLDEDAFDQIVLTQEAGGETVRVFDIEFPGGKIPANPDPNSELEVTLMIYPDRRYRVFWRDIERVETYEQLLLQAAKSYLAKKDYANAFEHLNRVIQDYPTTPMLGTLKEQFLFDSAKGLFAEKRFAHALAVLEEIRRSNPNLKPAEVEGAISNVASQLIESYFRDGKLEIAQQMIARLEIDYGDKIPAVAQWKSRFTELARKYGAEAIKLRDQKKYDEAHAAAIKMLEIDPDVPGGLALLRQIDTVHPMLRVGVFQSSTRPNPTSLGDWPARRMGALVTRSLFEFESTGPEGGKYNFVLGNYEVSADQTELMLRFNRSLIGKNGMPDAYQVGHWMLRKADASSPFYDPGWASIFKLVEVDGQDYLRVQLRQSHVLPFSFMQWPLDQLATEDTASPQGTYKITEVTKEKSYYSWNEETAPDPGQPIDVIEFRYDKPYPAISDLLKGRIDVIDRIFPSDAKLLANDRRIRVESYALPIVHMLVPKSDDPYVSQLMFRRALLYSIDRESILQNDLLGGPLSAENRPISGPFPVGSSENDPLSYAYNESIKPLAYDLNLAKFLIEITKKNFELVAEKTKEPAPVLKEIVLGVPDFEAARVAGEVFIQQWGRIGVPSRLVVLTDENKDTPIDFLYVSAAVWEPAVDANRLLGEGGIAMTDNPFIVQALTRLRLARNWRQVRGACQDLHELVNSHLPILPLWQVGEMFAYRADLTGVPRKPVTLYQNVQRWRLNRDKDGS